MWISRLTGLFMAMIGAAMLAFLWSQLTDRSGEILFVHRIGIPGVLLVTAAGTLLFAFGAQLLLAPRLAARRWRRRRVHGT